MKVTLQKCIVNTQSSVFELSKKPWENGNMLYFKSFFMNNTFNHNLIKYWTGTGNHGDPLNVPCTSYTKSTFIFKYHHHCNLPSTIGQILKFEFITYVSMAKLYFLCAAKLCEADPRAQNRMWWGFTTSQLYLKDQSLVIGPWIILFVFFVYWTELVLNLFKAYTLTVSRKKKKSLAHLPIYHKQKCNLIRY